MINQQNLELFYDVINESIYKLYEFTKEDYFTLIINSCKNIISNSVNQSVSEEQEEELMQIYAKLEDIDFKVEEVRKALQAVVLQGCKEKGLKTGEITPDTLGIFLSYLITKFQKDDKRRIKILDPVIGSSNLICALNNHLEIDLDLYGIENNPIMLEIAQVFSRLQNIDLNLYLQDSLDINIKDCDYVIGDFPAYKTENDTYFDMDCILHHRNSLKDDGYMLCIISNDFFYRDKENIFKKELLNNMSIVVLIELPKNIFKENAKSILILQKNTKKHNCLLVELPDFNNADKFSQTLKTIEMWFKNQK